MVSKKLDWWWEALESAPIQGCIMGEKRTIVLTGVESWFCFICWDFSWLAVRFWGGGGAYITTNLSSGSTLSRRDERCTKLYVYVVTVLPVERTWCSCSNECSRQRVFVSFTVNICHVFNKASPRHLASQCYSCRYAALLLISPTSKWVCWPSVQS